MKRFPEFKQHDSMDCGAACIKIIAEHYGREYTLSSIKEVCTPTREGVSMASILETLEDLGFRCVGGRLTVERLVKKLRCPASCIGSRTIL